MPRDITNVDFYDESVQRRVLRRIFTSVDLECDNIEEILEYRSGTIVARFAPTSKGEGVTYLEIK